MKNTILQLLLIAGLAVVAGTVNNLRNQKDPERFLKWVQEYPHVTSTPDSPTAKPPAPTGEPSKPQASSQGAGTRPEATRPPVQASDFEKSGSTSPPQKVDEHPSSEFPMIPIDEAFDELQRGTLFIDARRTRDYEAGHVPGALSVSPWEGDNTEKIAKLVQGGAVLEAPVVVYCGNSKECTDSKMIAALLKQAGFLDLKIYQGGFPEWSQAKPTIVAKGKEPGKLDDFVKKN